MPKLLIIVQQEEESKDEWTDVTMRHNHPMRVPVTLAVATTHLRITTVCILLDENGPWLILLLDETFQHPRVSSDRDYPSE